MREDKRNESKRIILFVAITMAVFFLFPVYAYTQIGRGIERREALRAEIETHGPWVEQAVWVSADGGAYVLPPSDEPYAQPTAYFFIRGEWRAFAVVCAPSYSLWFEDPETGERAFESDFDLDETTVTLRRVKRSDYSYICPERRTYVLTRAADYEQALAALPFTPADS